MGKKKNSVVPNPNPNPNREIVQNPNQRNRKGKEGEEGGSALLAVEHAGARGKRKGKRKGRSGVNCSPERPLGRRGQAARRRRAHPLGSAHAGEGASDGAITPPFRPLDSLGLRLRCGEESGEERERAKKKMMIRVWERRPMGGFDIPK